MVDLPTHGIVSCFYINFSDDQFDAEACPLVSEIIADACCMSRDTPDCDVCYNNFYGVVSLDIMDAS